MGFFQCFREFLAFFLLFSDLFVYVSSIEEATTQQISNCRVFFLGFWHKPVLGFFTEFANYYSPILYNVIQIKRMDLRG